MGLWPSLACTAPRKDHWYKLVCVCVFTHSMLLNARGDLKAPSLYMAQSAKYKVQGAKKMPAEVKTPISKICVLYIL